MIRFRIPDSVVLFSQEYLSFLLPLLRYGFSPLPSLLFLYPSLLLLWSRDSLKVRRGPFLSTLLSRLTRRKMFGREKATDFVITVSYEAEDLTRANANTARTDYFRYDERCRAPRPRRANTFLQDLSTKFS